MKVSPAHEDYLEALVELENENGAIRSVDLAAKLSVSKGSVTKALKTLKDAQFITQPPYGDITLTPSGRAYGEKVLERHLALKGFLMNTLGVDEVSAEKEACAMEHTVSDETMERWVAYLKESP